MGPDAFAIDGRTVRLPTFFPSVSSVKSNERPSDYVRLLSAVGEAKFLVSAYDLDIADEGERNAMATAVRDARSKGASVLLDSGSYESYWRSDASWTADRFSDVLRTRPAALAFCYDQYSQDADAASTATAILAGLERDQSMAADTTLCPIVHGASEHLPILTRLVAEKLHPVLLAVAERDLGRGILARARLVRRLRRVLDEVAPSTVLHLLGTGSPVAILVYSIVGAQSFDGLEWCRTCVDPQTARLHHFHHRDLVQTLPGCQAAGLGYDSTTLLHNLCFFRGWMDRIRESLRVGQGKTLLGSVLPVAKRDEVLALIEAS